MDTSGLDCSHDLEISKLIDDILINLDDLQRKLDTNNFLLSAASCSNLYLHLKNDISRLSGLNTETICNCNKKIDVHLEGVSPESSCESNF